MLNQILEAIDQAEKPVVKTLLKTEHTKVLGIGLKKDVQLKEHTAPCEARLIILQGSVQYETANGKQLLNPFDMHDIPLQEKHALTALDNSLCLLILY